METNLFDKVVRDLDTREDAMVCSMHAFNSEVYDIRYGRNENLLQGITRWKESIRGNNNEIFHVACKDSGGFLTPFEGIPKKLATNVRFRIASRKPFYLPRDIDVFMLGLVPDVEAHDVLKSRYEERMSYGKSSGYRIYHPIKYVIPGRIDFIEKIGEVRKKVAVKGIERITSSLFQSLVAPEVENGERAIKREEEINEDYYMKISIHVIPHIEYAKSWQDLYECNELERKAGLVI